ncbi:hypothetical protein [Ruegeria atlantica]|uniref:hypothetical protein n=1 Tax=Ruegeria atlantica TaxID=81569 RepID=UPI00147DDF11|nr:hypothetical protein [Ruegeria atlantica]
MPDSTLAKGFIGTAKKLVPTGAVRPTQANLRRAVSSCYYAVFHALAKVAADSMVGAVKSKRSNKAWVEVYRGLGHGNCYQGCKEASKKSFPQELQDFADAFVQLQNARHRADYDPTFRLQKKDVQIYLNLAEQSIITLNQASILDKRAFTTWVLISSPGAKKARELAGKSS